MTYSNQTGFKPYNKDYDRLDIERRATASFTGKFGLNFPELRKLCGSIKFVPTPGKIGKNDPAYVKAVAEVGEKVAEALRLFPRECRLIFDLDRTPHGNGELLVIYLIDELHYGNGVASSTIDIYHHNTVFLEIKNGRTSSCGTTYKDILVNYRLQGPMVIAHQIKFMETVGKFCEKYSGSGFDVTAMRIANIQVLRQDTDQFVSGIKIPGTNLIEFKHTFNDAINQWKAGYQHDCFDRVAFLIFSTPQNGVETKVGFCGFIEQSYFDIDCITENRARIRLNLNDIPGYVQPKAVNKVQLAIRAKNVPLDPNGVLTSEIMKTAVRIPKSKAELIKVDKPEVYDPTGLFK